MNFLLYGFINPEIDVSDAAYMTFVRRSNNMDWSSKEEKFNYFEEKLEGLYFYSLDGRVNPNSEIVVFGSMFSYKTTKRNAVKEFGVMIDFQSTLQALSGYNHMIISGLFRTEEEMWEQM